LVRHGVHDDGPEPPLAGAVLAGVHRRDDRGMPEARRGELLPPLQPAHLRHAARVREVRPPAGHAEAGPAPARARAKRAAGVHAARAERMPGHGLRQALRRQAEAGGVPGPGRPVAAGLDRRADELAGLQVGLDRHLRHLESGRPGQAAADRLHDRPRPWRVPGAAHRRLAARPAGVGDGGAAQSLQPARRDRDPARRPASGERRRPLRPGPPASVRPVRLAALAALGCALVLAAGCGGSGGATDDGGVGSGPLPPPPPPVSTGKASHIVKPWVTTSGGKFVDQSGQPVILHGFDMSVGMSHLAPVARQLGANMARVYVGWDSIQPEAPRNGRYRWDAKTLAKLDKIVAALRAVHINVLIDFHQFHWSPYFAQATCKAGKSVCRASGVPAWYYAGGRFPATRSGSSHAEAA